MNAVGNQDNGSIPLPVQTDLAHRGGVGPDDTTLFPPPGTFEALGGRAAVTRIVDGLYDRLETDPLLRPAFSRDLTAEREKVKLFFEAWLGGLPTYFNRDWPPGLKVAHGGISISPGMAGRWLKHFHDACTDAVGNPDIVSRIKPALGRLAMAFVNRTDEPVPGERLRCSTYGSDPDFLRHIQRDHATGITATATAHPKVISRHGPRLLLIAAVRGKAVAAEELLRQGVDPNAVALLPGSEASTHGLPVLPITPLCAALEKRRDSMVRLLIERGAQYDIYTAAWIGDLDAVRKLLDLAPELADACDPACDVARITPLTHAVYSDQIEVARLLLQRGASVGVNSVRLVRAAANRGDEALTDLLLEHGADPAEMGAGTWVMYPAIADRLLALGANVNQESGAWIGLCCTGNSGHRENPELARAMLRCGADVTVRYKGRTALHCAAKAGFVRVVEALIEHGGDVNALSNRGLTPLDEVENAVKSIDREPMRHLLIAHHARKSKHEVV